MEKDIVVLRRGKCLNSFQFVLRDSCLFSIRLICRKIARSNSGSGSAFREKFIPESACYVGVMWNLSHQFASVMLCYLAIFNICANQWPISLKASTMPLVSSLENRVGGDIATHLQSENHDDRPSPSCQLLQ